MQPARRAATYEDLLALPEGSRAEILSGVLVTPPAPLPRHALARRTAARFIGGPRTLEALRFDASTSVWVETGSYDDASGARIAPFEAIELEVGRLFPPR